MSNYSSSHFDYKNTNNSWAMTYRRIPNKSKVLDIGCSSGSFGKELIQNKNCIVDGIELNSSDATKARSILRNVYVCNIENDPLPEESYDIIFMGDVIEHLVNPAAALCRVRTLLAKNGSIIFSIPNITHMSVRLMLLGGNINYGKTGLLDETHLHFYNQKEIYRIFNIAGFKVDDIEYVKRDIAINILKKELLKYGLVPNDDFTKLAQSTDAAAYQFVGSASMSDEITILQNLPAKSPIDVNDKQLKIIQDGYKNKISKQQDQIEQIKKSYDELYVKAKELSGSNSYKIGRILTLPIRSAKISRTRAGKFKTKYKNTKITKNLVSKRYRLVVRDLNSAVDIALVIRSIEHPTSSTFIRLISPLASVIKKPSIQIVDGDNPKLSRKANKVIVQRTAVIDKATAEKLVKVLKRKKTKLFIDTDDAFSDINKDHPQYALQKDRIEALDYLVSHADGVMVSTEVLASRVKSQNITVVQNTVHKDSWKKLKENIVDVPKMSSPLKMVYMGTKTHDGDFMIILPALKKLAKKYPDMFELTVIGVGSNIETYKWLKQADPPSGLYPNFTDWFSGLGAFDIGLSPLDDTEFNKNKSDIKCLDYLAIGAKPIVSNVSAYKNSNLDMFITRVDNSEIQWYDALETEIKNVKTNRKKAHNRIEKGYEYLRDSRMSDKAGEQILRFIK